MPGRRSERPAGRQAYLLVFALNETFALPIAFARSGLRIENLAPAPSARSHVVGFANLGGAAVAVVCLARRLEPNARPREPVMAVVKTASPTAAPGAPTLMPGQKLPSAR